MSPGLEAGPCLVWAFDLPDPLTRVITAGSCGPSTGSFYLLWSKWEFKQTLLRWPSILRGIIIHRVEGRYLCAKKWGAPADRGRGSTHVTLWVKLGGLQAHAHVCLGWSLEACRRTHVSLWGEAWRPAGQALRISRRDAVPWSLMTRLSLREPVHGSHGWEVIRK